MKTKWRKCKNQLTKIWKNERINIQRQTITEIKNTLEGINSRVSEAEGQISELKDKMAEISSEEQNKVKRMKRAEDSLRNLWDHIKCTTF